ncbi:thioester-containing protein 1 allele S1-like [Musca autumnalis]|uniref:thioester-containing protein 1 allele S1-like n=1 Tax=Musca autumnalis TaxID=221902 RepID=UPI003CF969D2
MDNQHWWTKIQKIKAFCIKMSWYSLLRIAFSLGFAVFVASQSYYSLLAPGVIKSNRNYTIYLTLHQSPEPVKINILIDGPTYEMATEVFLKPFESQIITFFPQKLESGDHKLIIEGVSGLRFYNESGLIAVTGAGPKIYIQTDKAVYKPGDVVQFRAVLLDEHTRPMQVEEPIRVEIMDDNGNRVKQYKDITLVKGVYKNKFQLSKYPVMGSWHIRVYISGRFDFLTSKEIKVQKYLLPKFSVYIETEGNILLADEMPIRALVYGQYTFDKYVEGQVRAQLVQVPKDIVLDEKIFQIKDLLHIEFKLNNTQFVGDAWGIRLRVELMEKFTGQIRNDSAFISIRDDPHNLYVLSDSIAFAKGKPYELIATVKHWNGSAVTDSQTPVTMQHGKRNYSAYLNADGKATFQFEHDPNANHIFQYGTTTYKMPNILSYQPYSGNSTESHLELELLNKGLSFGNLVRIKVSSSKGLPYLVYIIVAHSTIIYSEHINFTLKPKSHILEITPSIDMIPYAFVYVYYIDDEGNYRYREMKLTFPLEFENKVSIVAPKQVKPGDEVTLELKAQPKSLVGVLAVDLGVYLLDPSYDLQKDEILEALRHDLSGLPFLALVYPGLLSGVVTMTNAHYEFVPLYGAFDVSPTHFSTLRFRKNFPETWIFDNYEITNDTTQMTLRIPDTITTWRLTAFSVNEKTGFGIVDGPTDITTIQPFFITLNLPYSVKRGEIVPIPILIHNYHGQSVDTEVTLYNVKDEFYFMESTIFNKEVGSSEQSRNINITISANSVAQVVFFINPREVGEISLQVTATNPLSYDAIFEKLRVEPEGIKIEDTIAIFNRIVSNNSSGHKIPLNIPPNIIPQSEFISLTAVGDSMAPIFLNLNDLLALPTGCGEQNMANFAPNILVLQYLKSMGQYRKDKDLVSKAKRYIEIGYQQQLTYRHKNGGYSVFGQRKDAEPSTWLTAYTIRFFIKSLKYTGSVESHIIESGLDYLASAQRSDGSFPYTGYLIYPAQQNRFGFTAFVLMTFMEDQKLARKYPSTIENAVEFLNSNLDQINDAYALSIMAVALHMAKQTTSSKKILEKLLQQKKSAVNDTTIWWSQNDRNNAKDIEITAYVLMVLLDAGGLYEEDCNRSFKWLMQQRNEKGGFKSSHDTVMGLQAIVKYSTKYKTSGELDIAVKYSEIDEVDKILETGEIILNQDNIRTLQTEELSKATRAVEVNISGLGDCLIQLTYHYFIIVEEIFKYFLIEPNPELPNPEELSLEVCFTYIEQESASTNMVIMEANLPSGYSANEEDSTDLLDNEIVQRIETKNSATTIIVYSEKLTANVKNCLTIFAYKMHDVVNRKPASVVVYDYYDLSRHDTAFYSIYKETS